MLAASAVTATAELGQLRSTRRLVALQPDFSGIQTENRMMDPHLALEALQIGKRQAQNEAAAIKAAWKV